MTQDDDVWQFQDDAYLALEYWKKRCLAAEEFIQESFCDPDLTCGQQEAHDNWQQIKNKKPC